MWHAEYPNESLTSGHFSPSSLQSSVKYPVLMEADASAGTCAGVRLTQRGSFAICQLLFLWDPLLRATRMQANRDQNLTLCTLFHYPISKVMPEHCCLTVMTEIETAKCIRGIASYCSSLPSHLRACMSVVFFPFFPLTDCFMLTPTRLLSQTIPFLEIWLYKKKVKREWCSKPNKRQ